jgi:hypothetical protein
MPLDEDLKQIAWKGVCVIAAHQYLRANALQGYTGSDGNARMDQRSNFEETGRYVIEYFLNQSNNET